MRLDGVAALVTGGGSGLGAATARALAEAGAKVAVLDRNAEAAQSTAAAIGGLALEVDVTDAEGVARALDAAREAHGAARIAVNCAGMAPAGKVVGRKGPMPLEAFEKTVAVNLIGTFNVMRLAAADMLALEPLDDGERGVIVNTASIAAWEGQIGQCAYAASKGGVASLTLPAAREFAPKGVRVVAIAPGLFETPMLGGMPDEVRASLIDSTLYPKRLGKPEEYAGLVLEIARNRMLNGSVLRLDGALRMAPS